ncbi:MAG TPA: TlpA disulfide reductase family protein [Geobacteraceae bacterium]
MKHLTQQLVRNLFLPGVAALLLSTPLPSHAVQLGRPAPEFSLADLQGNTVSISSLRGKVVILNFWSTACVPCVKEIPALNNLYLDLQGDGLSVLGIALDSSDKPVRELASRLKIRYPVLLDKAKDVYFDAYGLFGQPVSVIIDRRGIVRDKIYGEVDWASQTVKKKLNNYLKGG